MSLAIEVSHLTKEYRLGAMRSLGQTLRNTGSRLLGGTVDEPPPFKALDDVNFTIERGEVVGIIGHNGAGKSTLLKMLAGISTPSSGSVKINGRIAPLIEVGAGFVPEFTGRENVYLNGSILGMSKKEIDRKFDDIVGFAEMADFIDTPVKRYSSGMQVKLAFAVATSVESEILIVDEVLAVGDLAFQRKCFERIEFLIKHESRTVLVVSHNLRQIERLCQRAILLNFGKIVGDGVSRRICNQMFEEMDSKILAQSERARADTNRRAISDGSVELVSLKLLSVEGHEVNRIASGDAAAIRVRYTFSAPLSSPVFGIGIHTNDFIYLATEQSYGRLTLDNVEPGTYDLLFEVSGLPLLPGSYSIRLGVAGGTAGSAAYYTENAMRFQVVSSDISRSWNSAPDEGFFALHGKWKFDDVAVTSETETSAA